MKNKNSSILKKFMSEDDKQRLGRNPTYHSLCKQFTGKARPGKTARDRHKGGNK